MTPITLHHETFGPDHADSPPLVLVHGGGGTIDAHFGAAIPVLAQGRRVIGVELQGHGRTPHADRAYTFENSADDIVALLDALGVRTVDVLAFSNGGPTALRLAQRHGRRARRVVVASSFYRRDGMIAGFWDGFAGATVESMPIELREAYRAVNDDGADLQRMFDLDVTLMTGFTDWADAKLAAIDHPVLFVGGDRDIVRPEHTLAMARLVRTGRALIVPSGHGDFLGVADAATAPDALVRGCLLAVTAFLDDEL